MDKATLLKHVARAEEQVAAGEVLIAAQDELVRKLYALGRNAVQAETLLGTLVYSQSLLVLHRNGLRAMLEALD